MRPPDTNIELPMSRATVDADNYWELGPEISSAKTPTKNDVDVTFWVVGDSIRCMCPIVVILSLLKSQVRYLYIDRKVMYPW